jgi:hypothetical protein
VIALTAGLAGACGLATLGEEGDSGTPTSSDGAAPADVAHPLDGARPTDGAHPLDGPGGGDSGTTPDASKGVDVTTPDAPGADHADDGPSVFTVVQSASANVDGSTLSTTLAPVHDGSFLAILATYYPPVPTITDITDNSPSGSNTYESAGLRSVAPSCQASEIWYARDTKPGATSVTVSLGTGANLAVWALEVSGMAASGGLDIGQATNGGPTTTITAPAITPSGSPALIVSAVGSCGTIGSLAGGSSFIALPILAYNDSAYFIATAHGAYGPVFENTDSGWNASVAAFR